MNLTAQEINDKYLVENQNATVLIEGEVENFVSFHTNGEDSKKWNMKEIYETKFNDLHYTFALGHFADRALFGEEIDISKIKADKIVLGHVHVSNQKTDNYLGVPVITNFAEKGYKPRLMKVKNREISYLPIPIFLDYYDIEYEDTFEPEKFIAYNPMLDIINAPSINEAKEKFIKCDIRSITVKREESIGISDLGDSTSIKDYLNAYNKINKMSKEEMVLVNTLLES